MNVFDHQWDDGFPPTDGWRQKVKRLVEPGQKLGMTLYELPPGETQCPYHFHHGADELLLVVLGNPTLRTPDGVRMLEAGDVEHFPAGPAGAHQVWNGTDEPARYVVAGSLVSPEVVEYPDSGKVAAMARGEPPFWSMHRVADGVDYFHGEEPHA